MQNKSIYKSITTIVILSWLGGAEVRIRFGCERCRVQFPAPARVFMFKFCFVVVVLSFSPITHYLSQQIFCSVNLFSILNRLQWPIIRIQRYRPSIFNIQMYTVQKLLSHQTVIRRPSENLSVRCGVAANYQICP